MGGRRQDSKDIAVNTTQGSAVQIPGGITVPNPLVLNTQAANSYAGGINWSGGLHSVGNGVTNTWSGAISENQDSGITADASNTLNLTGGINQNAHIVVFGGAGNINVTTNPITLVHSLDKIGSGTTTIQVPTAAPTGNGRQTLIATARSQMMAGNYSAAANTYERALRAGADPASTNQRLRSVWRSWPRRLATWRRCFASRCRPPSCSAGSKARRAVPPGSGTSRPS